MNSISWFVYTAQVSNSLGILFCVLGGIGLLGVCFYGIIATIAASIDKDAFVVCLPRARIIAAPILMLTIGNMMPATNTMYAIAASQVGEQLVNNETVKGVANDATKALQQWIKKQIEPTAKK